MPSIELQAKIWDGQHDWTSCGEDWSAPWGGSEPQWFGSLYPRLHRVLPAGAILEIGPGAGRWTKFLLPMCQKYTGVDLSAQCIESCKGFFESSSHARFLKNDGMSLDVVPDNMFDLVFTFDSLVHAETEVMDSYVPQILRKLAPGGVAFVHHSNMAALSPMEGVPHGRSFSVSAETVASAVRGAGGNMLIQEIINWHGVAMIDCISTFCRPERDSKITSARIWNSQFGAEVELIRTTQAPYSGI